MWFDSGQPGGLSTTRRFLRNQQALGVEIAKILDLARTAERSEDVVQRCDSIYKAIAAAVHDRAETLLLCVPPAVGMPRRRVLDDEHRAGNVWTSRPRQ